MNPTFVTLICGYGVPENMDADPNYQAYLHPVINYLFDRYRDARGVIVASGGPTDLAKPYRRTEASEIKRWIASHLKSMPKTTRPSAWRVAAETRSLTTVENLLNFVPYLGDAADVVVFCEHTRAARVRTLARAIPALRAARVVGIDFDASPRRYSPAAAAEAERASLRVERAAVSDPRMRARVRAFAQEKLRRMHQYDPTEAHRHLPDILRELREQFWNETKKNGA